MNARQKRRIRCWTLAGAALTAAGLWVGYYRVAFFLPGMTAHKLRQVDLGSAA